MYVRLLPWLPGMVLSAAALLRPWLEASMARHMAIELPLLFAVGFHAAVLCRAPMRHALERWNAFGIPGLAGSALILGYWMLPVALDSAVLSPSAGMGKVGSMVLAGVLGGLSWRSAGIIVQAFFVLNWAWMTFVAGLLYQSTPDQLCSVYLSNQQESAGLAMMALAAAVLMAWLFKAFQWRPRQFEEAP